MGTHNLLILGRCKRSEEREFYLRLCLRERWGKRELERQLDDSRIIESEEVSPGVVLDFNEQNQVVGIEMLNLSKRAPQLNPHALEFVTV